MVLWLFLRYKNYQIHMFQLFHLFFLCLSRCVTDVTACRKLPHFSLVVLGSSCHGEADRGWAVGGGALRGRPAGGLVGGDTGSFLWKIHGWSVGWKKVLKWVWQSLLCNRNANSEKIQQFSIDILSITTIYNDCWSNFYNSDAYNNSETQFWKLPR